MNIIAATQSFEAWLRQQVTVHEPDMSYKYQQMSLPKDPFPFFRGTYYRWLQHWPTVATVYNDVPRVLAVGDLHIENFGTWRDAEGRLVWGINDFDEAAELPYTNDLVRLAASVRLAKEALKIKLGFRKICTAIVRGYRQTLRQGGNAFVLEEHFRALRRMAVAQERSPGKFWKKFHDLLRMTAPVEAPNDAVAAIVPSLPSSELSFELRFREQTGMGSLGKPRYLALTKWKGSRIAREAKALTPPANQWVSGQQHPSRIDEILQRAVRCHDPFFRTTNKWIIRRLAARCSRIELKQLKPATAEIAIFTAMGAETANIHLGTQSAVADILYDLEKRQKSWLAEAAKPMAKAIKDDWKEWREREE
jgi:hypothetical protein